MNFGEERRMTIMARLRRKSTVLDTARQRLAGLKAILPAPDMGKALTLEGFEAEIEAYSARQDSYNSKLATLDDETNQLDDHEQRLHDLNQRIQAAVKAQYGPDSSEFELVGGIRRSDRKKPARTTKAPAAA